MKLDDRDLKILAILQAEGRITKAALSFACTPRVVASRSREPCLQWHGRCGH